MLFFCGYRACYCSSSSFSSSSSFRSSPVYAFSGRPPGGAGCRERSQRSCLRPGGLPSLTRNPGLAATVPVAPPLSRRGLRSRHPGKRPPGCKRIWLTHYYPSLQMRYELRTTVRVSDEWLSVCAICLHTGLNPKGHQAAYALPNLFAAHDNEEPRYKGQRRFANRASRRCGGSRNSTDDGG